AEIGSERLDRRLRWNRRDEVGRLASAFDAMLDRLQSAFARERQFISDASHELRTPLTVINSNAQMLQRWGDRDPEVMRTSLEAIAEESGRLAGMVSGMLTLSKAEAGDAIPKEPLVLERLVDDVVAHAQERAAANGLTLEAHHAAAPGTIVVGDAGLLRQLVGNLIDNALKFTNEGRVDVTVRREDGKARIEVADTGPGVDELTADRLFDRFFRGDPSHARAIEGTGLGLAIVRSIARVHGGTVEAHPRPGGGSVFTVALPAEPESFTAGS
ncbi:MAG TPA: HAMP domain-containing sensor histidine kinase, partial [Candidatus Elarobacter sp.]